MPSWKKIVVSGSDAALNSLFVSNAVTASVFSGSFTGSLFGTSSWAISSSLASSASYYQIVTGSSGTDFNIVPTLSGSFINIPDASNSARGLITTASQAIAGQKTFTGVSTAFNGSIIVGGTIAANSSLVVSTGAGVASTAASQLQLLGSSNMGYRVAFPFAAASSITGQPHASVIIGSNDTTEGGTGTQPLVSQLVVKQLNLINSTGTTTNGATVYIEGDISGSANPTNNYALWVDSGSIRFDGNLIMSQSNVIVTGSVISTGGFTGSLFGTASYVTGALFTSTNPALTASYALTASFALNAGAASSITVADEGTSQGTATFLNFTGAGVTVSPVTSNTASINIPGGAGDTFPYTGSAQITGSLGVTGSISVTQGGFTGSLFGTASYVTASNVYGPYGGNSVLSSSFSATSSYLNPIDQLFITSTRQSNLLYLSSSRDTIYTGSHPSEITPALAYFRHLSNTLANNTAAGIALSTSTNGGVDNAIVGLYAVSVTSGDKSSDMAFATRESSGRVSERWRIDFSGSLLASGSSGAGLASRPIISRLSDNDTGIYFPNNNEIAISAGGVENTVFKNGSTSINASLQLTGSLSVSGSTIINTQQNTDVDIGTEVVATLPSSSMYAAFFDYSVTDLTNYRAGTVMAVWNTAGSVQYTDNSTPDIGDTSGVTLAVVANGSNVELRATVTTNNWNIKTFVRSI